MAAKINTAKYFGNDGSVVVTCMVADMHLLGKTKELIVEHLESKLQIADLQLGYMHRNMSEYVAAKSAGKHRDWDTMRGFSLKNEMHQIEYKFEEIVTILELLKWLKK